MDDSERSYGYSQDLYHGRPSSGGSRGTLDPHSGLPFSPAPTEPRWERSYEYGPEKSLDDRFEGDLSPEEEALHVVPDDRDLWSGDRRRGTGAGRDAAEGAESLTWFAPGPYAGRGPRGWRRPDERILEEVCQRLADDGEVDASDVAVGVRDGEVTLEGTIPSRRMKRLADGDAEVVRGVVDVHNRLRVAGGGAAR